MKNISFKHRFILSFVTIEIIFLIMIAIVNFKSMEKASNSLINTRVESLKSLGSQILATPVSIYDLATIDLLLTKFVELDNIIYTKVLDSRDRVLSSSGNLPKNITNIKKVESIIYFDNIKIGKFYLWLDMTNLQELINSNQQKTIILILFEILLSTFLSWLIGHNLAYNLNNLKDYAEKLSKNLNSYIPTLSGAKELSVLSNTLEHMRKQLLKDRYELKQYRDIINENIMISRTDLKGNIIYASNAFCNVSGYSKNELIGKNHSIIRHKDMPKEFFYDFWKTIKNNKVWKGEIKNKKKDGSYYWVEATISPWIDEVGSKIGYIGIRHDITDKKRVEELSITDELTKLYNRHKLEESFDREINRTKRYNTPLSMILLDIDHFKSVNDTYGHDIGDETLKDIAKILKSSVRKTDIIGRWGGEEFIVIAPGIEFENIIILANKIRKNIENHHFKAIGKKTSSFGVSTLNIQDSKESFIKRADDGLYKAKKSGRNCVKWIS